MFDKLVKSPQVATKPALECLYPGAKAYSHDSGQGVGAKRRLVKHYTM